MELLARNQHLLKEARVFLRSTDLIEPVETVFVKHHVPFGAEVPEEMYADALGHNPELMAMARRVIAGAGPTATALRRRTVQKGTPAVAIAIYNQADYFSDAWSSLTILVITTNIEGEDILLPVDPDELAFTANAGWLEVIEENRRNMKEYFLREMASLARPRKPT